MTPASGRLHEALDRVVEGGGEADDVLRKVVALLVAEAGVEWAGVAFVEGDSLVLGPEAGMPDEASRSRTAILYDGVRVGELWVDGHAEQQLLSRVVTDISPYVLIGWDTQGTGWEP